MATEKYDFGGWATKYNIRCADGRTIRKGAFKDCIGKSVPIVWQHMHDDPGLVLGHAVLEDRPEGIWAWGKFNPSDLAQHTKMLINNGDINSLSIYANQLKQSGGDVLHGNIRELSIVISPANPGATIMFPSLSHGDDESLAEEAVIYMDEKPESVIEHSDKQEEPAEPKKEEKPMAENKEKTVKDVFNELTDEQKQVVYYLIGMAANGGGEGDAEEEDDDVKHNVFDNEDLSTTLSHSDFQALLRDAKSCGSLKEAVINNIGNGGVLAHAVTNDDGTEQTYAMANMNYLFPDYKTAGNIEWIRRDNDWVGTVMAGVTRNPFARIKSIFADITMDEARARGYMKGNLKKEEVFKLLKRTTDPQTVYKKQKIDRDDMIDIVDFDAVNMIKKEMRGQLDEELARAILIGDGRSSVDEDKISEDHIRPILTDASLFTVHITVTAGSTDAETAKNTIDAAVRGRKEYKGSGNTILFTDEDHLADLLLLEDGIGHKLYKSEQELATAMRVKRIVTVPQLEGLVYDSKDILGIIVDLKDYRVGADKGGAVNMFDDFDIDYNQQKYLIETRCSGALSKPYSALVLEKTHT